MPAEKLQNNNKPSRKVAQRQIAPAANPESREQQMINHAVTLAEKQLMDGTASAAVITHYLKLATKKEHLEREILQEQAKLVKAKTENITDAKNNENLAKEAVDALKGYTSGS